MLACVWTSYTAKTVEVINFIDSIDRQDQEVSTRTDECCRELEALVADWKMEAILTDNSITLPIRCLVADHVMNIYAVIVGLKKLANRVDNINTVDAITVRAARKVVGTLLNFEQDGGKDYRESHEPITYFVQ